MDTIPNLSLLLFSLFFPCCWEARRFATSFASNRLTSFLFPGIAVAMVLHIFHIAIGVLAF